jgi:hypothetical protein
VVSARHRRDEEAAVPTLDEPLVKYLIDAHALERNRDDWGVC